MGKIGVAINLFAVFLLNACAGASLSTQTAPPIEPVQSVKAADRAVDGKLSQDMFQQDKDPLAHSPQKADYFRHTVSRPGETLSHIALWYTGKVQNWKKIAEDNPSLIVDSIKIGDVILIPKGLLITREQMPYDFSTPTVTRSEETQKPDNRAMNSAPADLRNTDLYQPVDELETKGKMKDKQLDLFDPVDLDSGT